MPWGGAGGQNIEHPHTLVILSSLFLLQMHLSFIGKAQFKRATLFCDSSYLSSYLWIYFYKYLYITNVSKINNFLKLKNNVPKFSDRHVWANKSSLF